VYDFLRRSSILEYSTAALRAQAGDIVRLANVEGLQAHGRAVALRLTDKK
jgi:histidinol dehydrogenase